MKVMTCYSDTTRASLIAIWWYLSKYPDHAEKIRSEIEGVDISDANALAGLPHLNGVVKEVLRLVPPAMTGGGRITGPQGLWVDGTFIPPFTKVTAPKYVIMRSRTPQTKPARMTETNMSQWNPHSRCQTNSFPKDGIHVPN